MNVYLVHCVYHNGITKYITPYSSEKKAQAAVDRIVEMAVKYDDWVKTDRTVYTYASVENMAKGVVITPPSGNIQNSEAFYIYKQEIL